MVSAMERHFRFLALTVSLLLIAAAVLGSLSALHTSPVGEAEAAEYSFSLAREEVNVTVLRDGSVDIDYYFHFTNVGFLDGVDIGLPNRYYDEGSANARIIVDGAEHSPSQVHESPYVDVGMAVEFGSLLQSAIQDHGEFQLYFHVNNPHMVYLNELVNDTVGVSFRATWFDPEFQAGPTGVLVQRLIFPEAFVDDSLALWYENNPWDQIYWDNATSRHVALWTDHGVSPDSVAAGEHDVGIGFPVNYVERYYLPGEDTDAFGSLVVLLTLLFPLLFMALFVTLFIVAMLAARRRRKDYYEPVMNVVGAGPRRDLTAVEAAIVLERPLEMVSAMMLFGLIRKGKVQVVSGSAPMRLRKLSDSAEHPYENDYLRAIDPDGTVSGPLLKEALVNLINATLEKMKGFDQSATQSYYSAICDRAWQQVKEAGTPDDAAFQLGRNNDWMMLDRDYPGRMQRDILVLPIFMHRPMPGNVGTARPGPDVGKMATDYVNNVRNAANNLVNDMRGIANDVVRVTNPIPVSSSGPVRGGGHCACACACAGGGR